MGLDLRSTISLDGSGFEAGIGKVTESLKGFALSAFGIYGVEQAIHKTIETATQLLETSNRLGIGTEKFQEFAFAAKQSGLEIETLTKFIENLNKNRVDPQKLVNFQRLGIAKPSEGDVADLVQNISAFVRLHGTQQISPDLIHAGGKTAGEAINFLNENLDELGKKAHEVGAIIKTDDLVSIKFLADQMEMLSTVMVSQLAPALVHVMNLIIRFINQIRADKTFYEKFFSNNDAGNSAADDALKDLADDDPRHPSRLKKRFIDAGAASQTVLEEVTDASDALLAKLKKEQAARERRNLVPEGESVAAPKITHSQVYSDSLLRVGNFLGSSSNPLLEIGRVHTTLLTRIAKNTDRITSGGSARSSLPIL